VTLLVLRVLPLVSYIAYASVTDDETDDDRRYRPLLVWPPTLCVGGPVIIFDWHTNGYGPCVSTDLFMVTSRLLVN